MVPSRRWDRVTNALPLSFPALSLNKALVAARLYIYIYLCV